MPAGRYVKPISIVLILISFVTALYLDFYRLGSEQANKNVEILVDYDEATTLAKANNIPLDALLRQFGEAGASGVLLRERTIKDLSQNGGMLVKTASELNLLRAINPEFLPGIQFRDGYTYLISKDERDYQYILEQLQAKKKNVTGTKLEDTYLIALHVSLREWEKLGIGFPPAEAAVIEASGLSLVPRVREWGPATTESLELLKRSLQSLPRLSLVTFNDEAIPALNNLPALAQGLKELGVPIGTYEFFYQQGLNQLGYLVDKNVLRVHAISENDMLRLSPAQALDRYKLAVAERNMRVLYVRLFGLNSPDSALESSLDFIRQIKAGVEDEGFTIGPALPFASLPYSGLLFLLLGLGAVGAGMLIFRPYLNGIWLLALGLLGCLGWAGVFLYSPSLARKGFALLTVILFPLVGILDSLREERRGMGQAVLQLLKISGISLLGAVIMTGLLADKSFMLKLDSFSGVKLAHAAPILLLAVFLFLQQKQPLTQLRKLAMSPVLFIHALLGMFVLAVLAVYLIRTGNEGTFLVSSWENTFREILDRVLGVRPRTKEFIFGHPFMLLVLYYGYDFRKAILLLFGLIGQISLINTYAHIHTPLLISLTRTFHGLWLGILGGIVLILVLNSLSKWYAGRPWRE